MSRSTSLLAPLYASAAIGGLFFLFAFIFFVPSPKAVYPIVFPVEGGSTVSQIANELHATGVLRSPFLFKLATYVLSRNGVQRGMYYLGEPASPVFLAYRMTKGLYGVEPIRFVVYEGETIEDIAKSCAIYIYRCTEEAFIAEAGGKEGYLFPDTYYLLPIITPKELVTLLAETFKQKTDPLRAAIDTFGQSFDDVVVMASLIEREARTPESRRLVSGILWKRIEIGMPLQVDAAFNYVNGKTTYELTTEDLRKDSPYNTYTNTGLPPGPIANPGLDSLLAAIEPTPSPYLFYLTDRSGRFYFAKTHDEHVRNKARYLR